MLHEHPYGTDYIISKKLPTEIDQIKRCFITLTAKSTGAFPERTKEGLNFPYDNKIREFHITGHEYLTALDIGLLKKSKIIKVIEFLDKITFTNYVNYFYDLKANCKKNDDKKGYLFAKFLLNGLYGKFAANPKNYSEYYLIPPEFIKAASADNWLFYSMLGKNALMIKPLSPEKYHYYNIAVGASITGFIRAYLLKTLYQVKNPIYCDTDSIICKNFPDHILGKNIGQWNLENTTISGAIAGKKLYAFLLPKKEWLTKDNDEILKYKMAFKGARLSAKEIIEIAKGTTITYKSDNPVYSLKLGQRFIDRNIKKTSSENIEF
jgi:hypothetical protein